jgi:hypothetical protein
VIVTRQSARKPYSRSSLLRCLGILVGLSAMLSNSHADTMQDWIRSFAESDIVFQRSGSNVPFLPLAFAQASIYDDTEVKRPGTTPLNFRQTSISQGAGVPLLLTSRDILILGEYVAWTGFDSKNNEFESFDVLTVGLPVAWLRQVNSDWQAAAFVMPLGHKASFDNAAWHWEVMGGAFGRYVQNDNLWWALGFFADVGIGEDLYLPYAGASWELSDELTISAVMPWPAILYAPSKDLVFRFGASPSGTSWSISPAEGQVSFELGNWDLGVAAERRLDGNLWLNLEAGIGGLRSFRVTDGHWQGPDFDLDASPYLSVGINFRPSL